MVPDSEQTNRSPGTAKGDGFSDAIDVPPMVLNGWLTPKESAVVKVLFLVTGLVVLAVLPRVQAARNQSSCQENLKRIGVALSMYAAESVGERYPAVKTRDCLGAVQPWSGAIDLKGVVPAYLESADVLVCPSYKAGDTAVSLWDGGHTTNPRWAFAEGFSSNGIVEPCEVLGKPYYYYGWAFSERSFECSARDIPETYLDEIPDRFKSGPDTLIPLNYAPEHYEQFREAVIAHTIGLDAGATETYAYWDLQFAIEGAVPLPKENSRIPFLRDGIERWYDRELSHQDQAERARIVVLHEELFERDVANYHGEGRMNILYMDGHVESRAQRKDWWSQRFPLNEAGRILRDAVDGKVQPSILE